MGIKVNSTFKDEINRHEVHKVKLSINAFQQYRNKKNVENPAGCLLKMIREEAEPNIPEVPEKSIPKTSNQSSALMNKSNEKLISTDKLKQLSNLFGKKNET